ncbi:MAG: hypothetical protein OIF58_00325 [Cohaesibacter sp.]|nr:hypothetical protein [Cohaesibacter sp.]
MIFSHKFQNDETEGTSSFPEFESQGEGKEQLAAFDEVLFNINNILPLDVQKKTVEMSQNNSLGLIFQASCEIIDKAVAGGIKMNYKLLEMLVQAWQILAVFSARFQ